MSRSTYYVTTPIYYVNGAPHLGHAYTTIAADAIARHMRQRGRDVFFMTGTDEHGLKVQREAEADQVSPQALADKNSAKFRAVFDHYRLTYDRFIRTTEPEHAEVVRALFARMVDRGDIYLDTYEGWYAAADEAFYAEDEIEDGKSKESGASVEWVAEESLFFRLSAYQDELLAWYDADPSPIRPVSRYNEIRSFVASGLKDLSISRTTFDWGIKVPGHDGHIFYVWLDALTNYLSGTGGPEGSPESGHYWPPDLQLLGKDIARFHCVYWPAFLMSAGIELPRALFVHGWWLVEGQKMSKREGNWIDPTELAATFPLDTIRYFLLREIPLGNDGNFARDRVRERHNSELGANFGNLVNRTFKMVGGFLDGRLPSAASSAAHRPLYEAAERARDEVLEAMDAAQPHRALEAALGLSSTLNLFLQENKPWKLAKQESERSKLEGVLYDTVEGIRWVALLLRSIIPEAAGRVLDAIGAADDDLSDLSWGALPAGCEVRTPPVLFERLEAPEQEEAQGEEEAPKKEAKAKEKPRQGATEGIARIGFDAFESIEMRVGLIEHAEKVEGARKLLRLSVDLGEASPRTVVAGIASAYKPEQLIGKRFALVTNLAPVTIFGVRSEAMLLAAETKEGSLELAPFSAMVRPGTRLG